MIKTETMNINGKEFIKTYSDRGCTVEREGVQYSEAIDPAVLNRVYTETDEPIESDEMTEIQQKAKAYDILMGVAE